MTKAPDGLSIKPFSSRRTWQTWLSKQYDRSEGIWIKLAKKDSGIKSVSYGEALDVALCFGWIDGMVRGLDDRYYLQRFTPRRKRSKWSKINRDKVTDLIERGEMQPAGMHQIELAKADGRWDAAYDSPKNIEVPPELERELNKSKKARKTFDSLSSQNRYAILHRLQSAKRAETRERNVAKYVAMLKAGETIYPQ